MTYFKGSDPLPGNTFFPTVEHHYSSANLWRQHNSEGTEKGGGVPFKKYRANMYHNVCMNHILWKVRFTLCFDHNIERETTRLVSIVDVSETAKERLMYFGKF